MSYFRMNLNVTAIAIAIIGSLPQARAQAIDVGPGDPIIPSFVREIEANVVSETALKEFREIRSNLKDPKKEDKGQAHFVAAVNKALEAGKKAVTDSGIEIKPYKMYSMDVSFLSVEERKKMIDKDLKKAAQRILVSTFYSKDEKTLMFPSYVELKDAFWGAGTINHPTCKVYMPRQGHGDGSLILQARLLAKGYNIKIVNYNDPVETFESPKQNGLVMYTKMNYISGPIEDSKSCNVEVYLGAGRGMTIKKVTKRNYTWLTRNNDCELLIHDTISGIPACHATGSGLRELEYRDSFRGSRVKHPDNEEPPMYDPNDTDEADTENKDKKSAEIGHAFPVKQDASSAEQ